MDWRRSFSRGVMNIARAEGPPHLIPVVWYRAPKGAKTYYGVHAFASGVWDRDQPLLTYQVGQQEPYNVPYYGGANIWGYRGQCVIGTPEMFEFGLTSAELVGPTLPIPDCCQPGPQLLGGHLDGGIVAAKAQTAARLRGGHLDGGTVFAQQPAPYPLKGGHLQGGVVAPVKGLPVRLRGGHLDGGVVAPVKGLPIRLGGGHLDGGIVKCQQPTHTTLRGGQLEGGIVKHVQPAPMTLRGGHLEGGVVQPVKGFPIRLRGGHLEGGFFPPAKPPHARSRGGELHGGIVVNGPPVPTSLVGGELHGRIVASSSATSAVLNGGHLDGGLVDQVYGVPSSFIGGELHGGQAPSSYQPASGIRNNCTGPFTALSTMYCHFSGSPNPANNVTIPADYDLATESWVIPNVGYFFGICNAGGVIQCTLNTGHEYQWNFNGNEFGQSWWIWSFEDGVDPVFAAFLLTDFITVTEGQGCYPPGDAPRFMRFDSFP